MGIMRIESYDPQKIIAGMAKWGRMRFSTCQNVMNETIQKFKEYYAGFPTGIEDIYDLLDLLYKRFRADFYPTPVTPLSHPLRPAEIRFVQSDEKIRIKALPPRVTKKEQKELYSLLCKMIEERCQELQIPDSRIARALGIDEAAYLHRKENRRKTAYPEILATVQLLSLLNLGRWSIKLQEKQIRLSVEKTGRKNEERE